MSSTLRMCILASSSSTGGSTIAAVLEFLRRGYIPNAEIACIITSSHRAGVIAYAKRFRQDVHIIPSQDYPGTTTRDEDILRICEKTGANAVWQSGWLHRTGKEVIRRFAGRIWNQHPGALSPGVKHYGGPADFGGKGMYGIVPVASALYYGQMMGFQGMAGYARATAHLLTTDEEDIDRGPIIAERWVPIRENDTRESLQRRLKPVEQFLHANVMAQLASEQILRPISTKPIALHPQTDLLFQARERALREYGR